MVVESEDSIDMSGNIKVSVFGLVKFIIVLLGICGGSKCCHCAFCIL